MGQLVKNIIEGIKIKYHIKMTQLKLRNLEKQISKEAQQVRESLCDLEMQEDESIYKTQRFRQAWKNFESKFESLKNNS